MIFSFLIIIAVLTLLLIWKIFHLWKKSNRNSSSGTGSIALEQDIGAEDTVPRNMETDWPTVIETPEGPTDAVTVNFSKGGAFIRCPNPLPVGEIFRVKICAPDKAPIDTKAKVTWTNVNVPDDRVVNRGMGVMFIKENSSCSNKMEDRVD